MYYERKNCNDVTYHFVKIVVYLCRRFTASSVWWFDVDSPILWAYLCYCPQTTEIILQKTLEWNIVKLITFKTKHILHSNRAAIIGDSHFIWSDQSNLLLHLTCQTVFPCAGTDAGSGLLGHRVMVKYWELLSILDHQWVEKAFKIENG